MNRKHFLDSITGGMALACITCMMAACSREEDNGGGTINGTGNGTSNAKLTIDLSTQITAIGDFVASNGIIVIRVASGNQTTSFISFSNICPHLGGIISYDKVSSGFSCATHGATFNQSGTVTKGPASTNMTTLMVTISGNTLTVQG
jgi:cytochrome b6-f complex iron-sulfur subunit